jgi:hypothetical protein
VDPRRDGSNNILVQPGLSDNFGVASGTNRELTDAEIQDHHRHGQPRRAVRWSSLQQPTVQFVGDPSSISASLSSSSASPAERCDRQRHDSCRRSPTRVLD